MRVEVDRMVDAGRPLQEMEDGLTASQSPRRQKPLYGCGFPCAVERGGSGGRLEVPATGWRGVDSR